LVRVFEILEFFGVRRDDFFGLAGFTSASSWLKKVTDDFFNILLNP
jgi:hypothetical protein